MVHGGWCLWSWVNHGVFALDTGRRSLFLLSTILKYIELLVRAVRDSDVPSIISTSPENFDKVISSALLINCNLFGLLRFQTVSRQDESEEGGDGGGGRKERKKLEEEVLRELSKTHVLGAFVLCATHTRPSRYSVHPPKYMPRTA